ncbi:serine/threonine-protein kinase [Dokdonella soli]|uniref:Protein kinase domain-containing protein n=1 Tax=Dokdonella soli TaxID=529810 RepID=A0ABN1IB41_9GAMM
MNDAQMPPLFSAERWRELRALIDRLDALSAVARAKELDDIALIDAELASAARALATAESTVPQDPANDGPMQVQEAMPAQIGPFRLLRPIGVGGMGVVYLAERHSTDFTQRVALKLLDGGASQASRLASRERSILASLVHANITAFVDAGIEGGRAWLAMEYVDGEPLLACCERLGLDMQARVRLFDQVCAAVAHAHSRLVVHRDLKPTNVLVSRDGTVKLLDFGIALMLDPGEEQTAVTRVFTPEYAAPEQLRGERATTATDVYALGLMLYELICGKRLPTIEHSGEWTTAELARYATTGTETATASHTNTKIATHLLRGDLGRITAHALAPNPGQRYQSVAMLREDLQRWLDHRPLGIGRPGLAYVTTRFMRRHRAAVAIAALAILALIGTSSVALWQAHEARLMATRADHAKTFLAALFADANPFQSKRSGKTTVDLLRDAAQRIDKEFADAPELQVDLRTTLAGGLMRLGEPKLARHLQQHSVDQLRQMHGERAPQVGAALGQLAIAMEESGDIDDARAQFSEAYTILRGADDAYGRDRISVMTGLAKMANRQSDHAEALRWHEAVLKEREAKEGPESADIAMDLMNLSADAAYQENFARSETLAQQAHTMLEHVLGPGHARSIYVDNELGASEVDMGHCAAAITTLGNAVGVARRALPPGAGMLGITLSNLGHAESCTGDDEAAIVTLREARSLLAAANDPSVGTTELKLGMAELRAHHAEALQTLDASRVHLAGVTSRLASATETALWAQAAYGAALASSGRLAEGERFAREARTMLLARKSASHVTQAEIDKLLADVLDHENAAGEARALREEALAAYRRVYDAEHPSIRALARELDSTAGR